MIFDAGGFVKRIYKYPLEFEGHHGLGAGWNNEQKIKMPVGAKILSVGLQGEHPMLWALVNPDPSLAQEARTVYVVGTGHELGGEFVNRKFIGTILTLGGGIVLHVFE